MDTKPETTAASPERPRRVIKRYSNRKLYDTKDSRYVTLLQIAEMVRGGEEVQIIDNNTKDDLTEVTLAQIIYEEQKAQTRSVPLQTLKEIIHQRTERVLSELREGPIGRLIPGAARPGGMAADGATEAAAAAKAPEGPAKVEVPAATPRPTTSLVEHAKETIEDWQHRIDERIREIIPSFSPWQQLQTEVKRLGQRLEALEDILKASKSKEDSGKTQKE